MNLFMCRVKDANGGEALLISHEKKFELGDVVQIYLANMYPVPDHRGLANSSYRLTTYLGSLPSEINGKKIKIHYFEITRC